MTLDSGPGRGIHSVWILGWGCKKPIEIVAMRPARLLETFEGSSSLFDGLHVEPLLLPFDGGLSPVFVGSWVI
jgi:hypothetical protein